MWCRAVSTVQANYAISFTAAATLTRLAPQLATGVVAHDRPISSLLIELGHPRFGGAVDRGGRGRHGLRGTVVQAPS